jgi:hypothetical protein
MAVPCTTELGPLRADFCTTGVEWGRLDKMYLTKVGDGLADWSQASNWNTRLNNASDQPTTGTYYIRTLNIVGELVEPEQTETEISLGRKTYSAPDFTVNIEVDDMGDLNYAFAQTLIDNGGGIYAAWFEGESHLYGGDDGIEGTLKIAPVITKNRKEIQKFLGTFKWTGGLPDRIVSPL